MSVEHFLYSSVMRWHVPHITLLEVLEASQLFDSRSDVRRNARQGGVKMNGVVVDDVELNDSLVVGDFINLFMDGRGFPLSRSFGTHQLILVERGKKAKSLIRVDNLGTEVLT